MKDSHIRYIERLYDIVPANVYEFLLSVFILIAIILIVTKGVKKSWELVMRLLSIEYIFLIFCSTVIFRDYTEKVGHNFTPLWSYKAIIEGREDLIPESIMNVMVFVPLGLLLSSVSRNLKWWMVLLIGFGVSVSIEVLQYFCHKGFSEIDDVFHNTLGCAIGIAIVAIIKGLWLLQKRYLMN